MRASETPAPLREALWQAITSEHLAYRRLEQARATVARWERRLELARARGATDLVEGAAARLARARADEARLRQEYERCQRLVAQLKAEALGPSRPGPAPPAPPHESSIEERFRQLEHEDRVERQLAELKARLAREQRNAE